MVSSIMLIFARSVLLRPLWLFLPRTDPLGTGCSRNVPFCAGLCGFYWVPSEPYKFIRFGTINVTKPYESICFADIHGPTPYKVIGVRWAFISQTPVVGIFLMPASGSLCAEPTLCKKDRFCAKVYRYLYRNIHMQTYIYIFINIHIYMRIYIRIHFIYVHLFLFLMF